MKLKLFCKGCGIPMNRFPNPRKQYHDWNCWYEYAKLHHLFKGNEKARLSDFYYELDRKETNFIQRLQKQTI